MFSSVEVYNIKLHAKNNKNVSIQYVNTHLYYTCMKKRKKYIHMYFSICSKFSWWAIFFNFGKQWTLFCEGRKGAVKLPKFSTNFQNTLPSTACFSQYKVESIPAPNVGNMAHSKATCYIENSMGVVIIYKVHSWIKENFCLPSHLKILLPTCLLSHLKRTFIKVSAKACSPANTLGFSTCSDQVVKLLSDSVP